MRVSGRARRRLFTFLDTSCRASSSKAFTLFSLDVMICCSCLKLYGWKDILVRPYRRNNKRHHVTGRPLHAPRAELLLRHITSLHRSKQCYAELAVSMLTLRPSHSVSARTIRDPLTNLLATLLIMILSGRSMVLAMVSTTRRAWRRVGQSKRLYITFCFLVHNRSNWRR